MRCNADVMRNLILTVVMVFVVSANSLEAAEIEVSVATDQGSYWPNEVITVSVTAYNPNDYEVTLPFGSTLQASYIMDNVYDWSSDKIFLAVLTEVAIGPQSSYTWDFDHDWEYTVGSETYGYDLSVGTHSVVGALQPESPGDYTYYSQAVEFEVVAAPPPPTDILIDFEYYPDGDRVETTGRLSNQYAPWGVHFRSITEDEYITPSVQSGDGNQYAKVGMTTYPPGFNIVADFDMPVYSIEADVSSAVGRTVTMIAKDANGAIIDSVVSASVPEFSSWVGPLQLETTTAIDSVEWWTSEQNASVMIDNLHIVGVPEPATLGLLLLGGLALLRRRPSS